MKRLFSILVGFMLCGVCYAEDFVVKSVNNLPKNADKLYDVTYYGDRIDKNGNTVQIAERNDRISKSMLEHRKSEYQDRISEINAQLAQITELEK